MIYTTNVLLIIENRHMLRTCTQISNKLLINRGILALYFSDIKHNYVYLQGESDLFSFFLNRTKSYCIISKCLVKLQTVWFLFAETAKIVYKVLSC